MTESNEQGQPLGLASTAGLGLVERLRQERRPTRWARGVDTDYPVAWEAHPLCQEAADALERLVEDRARFPDRPDDIGAMIGAHFSNLRARADTHEEAWRRTQLRSDVEVARLRAALEQIVRDCTARKAVMIARKALVRHQPIGATMEAKKYHALDEAICAHIRAGRGHPTNSRALEAIARPLLASNKTPFPVAWRLIDRRMQTMRKAGRLVYERTKGVGHGKWRVVDA